MAKDITPGGRDDDRFDENTPSQDDAWAERLRREDEDQDVRATTELPAAAPGQPTAPTRPIVADDQRTRELPTEGSAFRAESSTRRRPKKGLLVGIGIAAAGLALVGTSAAVAVSNADGSTVSASSTATPGQDDTTDPSDGATEAPTDAPTPPTPGDEADGSGPAEGTGPDGKALPTPGTGPDGEALPDPGTGPDGKALPTPGTGPDGKALPTPGTGPDGEALPDPADGAPADGPADGGPKGPGHGHSPAGKGGPEKDADGGDDSDRPVPPTDAPTPPTDAPTPTDAATPGIEEGSGS